MKISLSVVVSVLAMSFPDSHIMVTKAGEQSLIIYMPGDDGGSLSYNLRHGTMYSCTNEWSKLFTKLNNKFTLRKIE